MIGRVTQGGGRHLTAPSVEIILICATYSGVLLLIFNFFLDLFQVIISVYQHSRSTQWLTFEIFYAYNLAK